MQQSQGGKELQESAARTMLAPGPPPSVTTCDEAVVGAEVVAGRDYGGRRAWRGAGKRAKARSRSLFGHAGLRVRRAGPGSRETTHGRVRPGDVDGDPPRGGGPCEAPVAGGERREGEDALHRRHEAEQPREVGRASCRERVSIAV